MSNITGTGINTNIDNSFIGEWTTNFIRRLENKREDVIKDALLKHGFNITNQQFIADNFELIRREGDPFEHLYYRYGKPDEIRILSISHSPIPNFKNEDGKFTATSTYSYY